MTKRGTPREHTPRSEVAPDLHGRPIPMRLYSLRETVDAVVVGTGAGGAPLLARLAAAGLRVVALEAGPHWAAARDFATDERAQAKLYWDDERLSAGDDPLHFGRNNSGTGVGGSTLHYTAYVPRPQPDDLRLHSEFGVGVDWQGQDWPFNLLSGTEVFTNNRRRITNNSLFTFHSVLFTRHPLPNLASPDCQALDGEALMAARR